MEENRDEKISLEIILSQKKERRTEYVLWTEHSRPGTIDYCRRGEIITDKLSPSIRGRLSLLSRETRTRNAEREGSRLEGIFKITDEEYLKKRRRAEAQDAIIRKAKAQDPEVLADKIIEEVDR